MTATDQAKDLIAKGFKQVSRKHRLLARMPEGVDVFQLLAAVDSSMLDTLRRNAESLYLRVHAPHVEVAQDVLEAFHELNGETA